jgi:ABC-type multidrug transport system fused ATPase/permease subunit
VLEQGRLVEQGTHPSLLAMPDGRYQRLYQMQFSAGEALV